MIALISAIVAALKPFMVPFMTFLAGVLFPSPLQKTISGQDKVHDAEKKADETGGDMSDLDSLP